MVEYSRPEAAGGQLCMAGVPGLDLDASTLQLIRDYRVHNFILFRRNVAAPAQLRSLCAELRQACIAQGLPAPLIAIDQEGGTVTRLPEPFTQFPEARLLAEGAEPRKALAEYAVTCARELLEIGINLNLAPVLDVCPAGQGYFMERRCLGETAQEVARLGSLVISRLQSAGVAACAKHFPGLGAARLDPHEQLPVVDLDRARLEAVDLIPFRAAIEVRVAAIMTSHTIYSKMDAARPATLSPVILTELLRYRLGYQGLVITDDLEMGAIETRSTVAAASLEAFRAGADLLLICHDHQKVRDACRVLGAAVEKGEIKRERLAVSCRRIAEVQQRFAGDPAAQRLPPLS